jgi:hypothetical protein
MNAQGYMLRNTFGSRSACKYRLTESFTAPLVEGILPLIGVSLRADMRTDSDMDRSHHVDLVVRYENTWKTLAVRVRCQCHRHYGDITMTSSHRDGKAGESRTADTDLYLYAWADHTEARLNEFLLADMKGLRAISLHDAGANGNGQLFSVCKIEDAQAAGLILAHRYYCFNGEYYDAHPERGQEMVHEVQGPLR